MRNRRVAEDVREQVDSDLASARARTSPVFSRRRRVYSRGFRARSASSSRPTRCTRSCARSAFLSVAPGKILAIQVNEPDVIVSRVIETHVEYSNDELELVSRRLTAEILRQDAARGPDGAPIRADRREGRLRPDAGPRAAARRSGARGIGDGGPRLRRGDDEAAGQARVLRRRVAEARLPHVRREGASARSHGPLSGFEGHERRSRLRKRDHDGPAALGGLDLLRTGRDTDRHARRDRPRPS